MTSAERFNLFAMGVLGAALLCFACGGGEPEPGRAGASGGAATAGAGNAGGAGATAAPTGAGDPAPLVALMRELDLPWGAALEASGWLEAGELDGPAAARWADQLAQAASRVQALAADPRFAAPSPALEVVFGAMKDGLGATFAQWASAAQGGDAEALRRARTAVETSCHSCHRSMRDEDPSKLARSMQRWETLHLRLRAHAVALERRPADPGLLAQIAGAAGELAVAADSGALAPPPGAPPEHEALRLSFQESAEALGSRAEKRDARAALQAFAELGYGCLSCHEARNVQPRQR